MTDGFLGRWARRKQDVREGRPLQEPLSAATPAPVAGPEGSPIAGVGPAVVVQPAATPQAPAPTLEDVQTLTPQSDFKRFVAADVDPQVRNAAVKKLFTDPHFNVMDGLDIYIDDYSKPDPLPLSMLRQMASAQFLKLVDEEPEVPAPRPLSKVAGQPATRVADAASMPQHPTDQRAGLHPASQAQESATGQMTGPQPTTEDHADTDLRLQQDHAAGAQGSGSGTG
jgi:hypothetical protein